MEINSVLTLICLSNLDKYLGSVMLLVVPSQSDGWADMKISAIVLLALTKPTLSFLPEVIVPDCHCEDIQVGLVLHCTNLHSTR